MAKDEKKVMLVIGDNAYALYLGQYLFTSPVLVDKAIPEFTDDPDNDAWTEVDFDMISNEEKQTCHRIAGTLQLVEKYLI